MVRQPATWIAGGPNSRLIDPADARLAAGIVACVVHEDASAALEAGDLEERPLRQIGQRDSLVIRTRPQTRRLVCLDPLRQRLLRVGVDRRHLTWRGRID